MKADYHIQDNYIPDKTYKSLLNILGSRDWEGVENHPQYKKGNFHHNTSNYFYAPLDAEDINDCVWHEVDLSRPGRQHPCWFVDASESEEAKLYWEIFKKYRPYAVKWAKMFRPKVRNDGILDDNKYYTYFTINPIRTKARTSFPVHVDQVTKLTSSVIYLAPEESYGTFFHKTSEPDSIYSEIAWKQNRMFTFSAGSRTLHSYSSSDQDRFTLVLNFKCLMGYGAEHRNNLPNAIYQKNVLGYEQPNTVITGVKRDGIFEQPTPYNIWCRHWNRYK